MLIGLVLLVIYGTFNPEQFPFPKCPFRMLTGWMCPGCGSQRAMYQLLHGHIEASMRLNPLFLPGIFYILIGYAGPWLFSKSWPEVRRSFYGLKAAYISLIIILIFWIGRNLF